MRKLIFLPGFLFLSLLSIFVSWNQLFPNSSISQSDNAPIARPHIYAALPAETSEVKGYVMVGDARPLILENYFRHYGSDLFPHAQYMVDVSDEFGLDFRLLAAIAMQESNLCKRIPPDSFNCWGYGIYGDQVVYFSSYEEGMRRVAKTLAEDYVPRGLDTPEKIMSRYTPPSTGSWADGVNLFLDIMEKGGIPE